jgi:hypothetical protein
MTRETIEGQIYRIETLLKIKQKSGKLTWTEIRKLTDRIGKLKELLKNAQ